MAAPALSAAPLRDKAPDFALRELQRASHHALCQARFLAQHGGISGDLAGGVDAALRTSLVCLLRDIHAEIDGLEGALREQDCALLRAPIDGLARGHRAPGAAA